MSRNDLEVIGTVPTIADGNPTTLLAISQSAAREGVEMTAARLELTSWVARPFHDRVTKNAARAALYTDSSEKDRAGWKGQAFGAASFGEFACRKALRSGRRAAQWDVVQEMPLLGARAGLLKLLGIKDIRLLTPDVYPKESGILAVSRHSTARISVWNQDAFDELSQRGMRVDLHRPYLLEGLRPAAESDFASEGVPIVVKSSGSGMPQTWLSLLEIAVRSAGVGYAIHTPEYRIQDDKITHESDFVIRTESFYNDLGGQTRLLIGYPSELVSVACELRSRGAALWMLALPPRGAHEKRNLEFGYRHGIIHSQLSMDGNTYDALIPELPLIRLADIPDILNEVPDQLEPGLLGRKSLWE